MSPKPTGFHTQGTGPLRVVHPHFAKNAPESVKSRFMHPSRATIHEARVDKQRERFNVLYFETMPWPSYDGMNWYAAQDLGLKFPYSKNTLVVKDEHDASTKRRVIRHEVSEVRLMKKGLSYKEAHSVVVHLQGEPVSTSIL